MLIFVVVDSIYGRKLDDQVESLQALIPLCIISCFDSQDDQQSSRCHYQEHFNVSSSPQPNNPILPPTLDPKYFKCFLLIVLKVKHYIIAVKIVSVQQNSKTSQNTQKQKIQRQPHLYLQGFSQKTRKWKPNVLLFTISSPIIIYLVEMLQSTDKWFLLATVLLLITHNVSSKPMTKVGQASTDTYRMMVYAQTQQRINHLNQLYGQYYTSAHNKFSELTLQEFAATYLGGGMSPPGSPSRMFVHQPTEQQKKNLNTEEQEFMGVVSKSGYLNDVVPTIFSVDYSLPQSLLITQVKDQGGCGSCWAFAGIGQIESFFMKDDNLRLDLSEQQMVDCLPAVQKGNAGCGGGYLDSVGFYSSQYPIALEKHYPYTAKDGTCNTARIAVGRTFKIRSYVYIYDCLSLANTLLTNKPIGVCGGIDQQWSNYDSGVIPNCNQTQLGGHCVLLVGASSDGTTNVDTNYWKVRNSWGTWYGESGFMKLYRNPTDTTVGFCGFCQEAIYSI